MNNEKDKGLDELFRKNLTDPVDSTGYKEEDWDALKQMLNQHKKRKGIVYWLPVLSSVAALLLLFWGWWIFRPQVINYNSKNHLQAVNHHQQVNTGTKDELKQQPSDRNQKPQHGENYANNYKTGKNHSAGKGFFNMPVVSSVHTASPDRIGEKNIISNDINEALLAKNLPLVFETGPNISGTVNSVDLLKNSANIVTGANGNKNPKSKLRLVTPFRPQYALTILAAPDINGVGSFQQTKVGTNVGMQFSAGVTRKITITTGVLYSSKPYTLGFGNYHTSYQFSETPVNVTADCRMLDIPINVGYQLYNKHQNRISLGTGLSSYMMLHESYKFNYTDPYASGPANYIVPNSSKYFFGVLNLNATYDRQINSKVAIEIQPYLKLPLTNLGYSQVRLQTTGVAVGIHWNLNSLSKP